MLSLGVLATETENLGISILPTPGAVTIDGKVNDWDLSGGEFICSDAENQRDKMAVWMHGMYDADNLYLLARWKDDAPMNNPGSTKGDYGFAGDCLQFRVVTNPKQKNQRASHWTCWFDREKIDVMDVAYGFQFNEGSLRDAKTKGAKQAFLKDADGKGYSQELSIPWSLIAKEGATFNAGDEIVITFEPNVTIGLSGRWTMKDNFKVGLTPDRVFTFMANNCWGTGTLEAKGKITPRPVRLADAREFTVSMANGVPIVDWTGIIKVKELKGFKNITFNMPIDGYISLNIKDKTGFVVRQLLNSAFYTKGKHTVKWDGLTTINWRTPGTPVAEGEYQWEAIWHKGIGLKLVGWAGNSGNAPWDSTPSSNWGGDHGIPSACATDGEKVYLGWSGAEAGKAIVATDMKGNVVWKGSRAGMSGANLIAVDNGTVYAQNWGGNIFRLESKKGGFTAWAGTDSSPDIFIKNIWTDGKAPDEANGLDAKGGKLFLSFTAANTILILDGKDGKVIKKITVTSPSDIKTTDGKNAYVISNATDILSLNLETGDVKPFTQGLKNARAIAIGKDGKVYVGLGEPQNQVVVFGTDGKQTATIGRTGGRALSGKWTSDGMAFINSIVVDAEGKLWVTEADYNPKRISVWNTTTGLLVKELFGPATYGALGGAICPTDPTVMAGNGVEWKLDAKTGLGTVTGTITRDGMEVSRYAKGANGKIYLAVAPGWIHGSNAIRIFERLGEGDYKLRTMFIYEGKDKTAKTKFWADENGDEKQQDNEVTTFDGLITFSGWYMGLTPDMTIYSGNNQYKNTGFTACGAPKYDLANPVKTPIAGLGSTDGKLIMQQGDYGVNEGWNKCYDITSKKLLWTYPDNFIGVHGSHNATPPEGGMIRGSYGPCGTFKMPEPIGNAWVIATNVGEWHILTEGGYYLTRLFEPDPMKFSWPEVASPGASMDNVPCGMGGEDFGGSITLADNGKLYVQSGKTGFWNIEVTGLENVKSLKGDKVTINAEDIKLAKSLRESYLQEVTGTKRINVKLKTVIFTGNIDKDFEGAEIVNYQKTDDAKIRTTSAWDENNLYMAWDVKDNTPWVNGGIDAAQLYIGGDTVDFQLGLDVKADKNRSEGVKGDMRLSIGSFKGAATAVIYRKVADVKKPMTFSSGIVREYKMDFVDTIADAQIKVQINPGKGYIVEAAIPLKSLDLKPVEGANLTLRGDFGVTHGDPAGQRTRLRSYWSNQHTGIVDDAVFELQMEPKNWGELIFK
jgi:hypothetical protein